MPPTLIATPGASNANSYLTVVEAQAYFDTRLPITEWDDADSQTVLLLMATRVLNRMFSPRRDLVRGTPPTQSYYRTYVTWTGQPSTSTQALSWPRTGMFNANGFAIATDVVPQELKEATAELAGQLAKGDRTLDNDVIVQGIKAIHAGSVAVTFNEKIDPQVIPDAVINLLVPSWLTDELIEPAMPADFLIL